MKFPALFLSLLLLTVPAANGQQKGGISGRVVSDESCNGGEVISGLSPTLKLLLAPDWNGFVPTQEGWTGGTVVGGETQGSLVSRLARSATPWGSRQPGRDYTGLAVPVGSEVRIRTTFYPSGPRQVDRGVRVWYYPGWDMETNETKGVQGYRLYVGE